MQITKMTSEAVEGIIVRRESQSRTFARNVIERLQEKYQNSYRISNWAISFSNLRIVAIVHLIELLIGQNVCRFMFTANNQLSSFALRNPCGEKLPNNR